ncbi:hypothetical protein ACFVOR_14870 [Streptomyces sp. NPDC057837]|uniref:hypothetical protein n=1 Tax=Streptomyces sp. NPDC057837 TaxID=3346260 RepID=UPI0036922B70
MTQSTNPQLSFELRADWLAGHLRADQIRTDTLVQLVAQWADPDARDEVLDALDSLAEVVHSTPREGELDAAVEAVESAASMETARIEIDGWTARRLFSELAEVASKLSRFNPLASRAFPVQKNRRTA